MKIILMMVSSLNGKITSGDDPDIYQWTSKEDNKQFFSHIKKHNLIVMGGKTYESSRDKIHLTKHTLRIVLTRNPKHYVNDTVKGQLEFTNETPTSLVKRLEQKGYNEMLLVGGSEINSLFFKSRLIDELHLTVEPKLFGTGKNLINESELNVNLQLIDIQKLNTRGTLHCVYKVL